MITILGPTACGKTALAVNLAAKTGGEIISADSRQVYRGMDIGTGKDLTEYNVDGKQIPYHLIDIEDAGQKYNLGFKKTSTPHTKTLPIGGCCPYCAVERVYTWRRC